MALSMPEGIDTLLIVYLFILRSIWIDLLQIFLIVGLVSEKGRCECNVHEVWRLKYFTAITSGLDLAAATGSCSVFVCF